MPRKLFKRISLHPEAVKTHPSLQIFKHLFGDRRLWILTRRSTAGAVLNGLFWAMIPMPFQMIPAAACAIFFRANLPLSIALVWITNPLTMPLIFYFTYSVGTIILHEPAITQNFTLTLDWFSQSLHLIWKPLFLGSLVTALLLSLTGHLLTRILWRGDIRKRWHIRQQKRLNRKAQKRREKIKYDQNK